MSEQNNPKYHSVYSFMHRQGEGNKIQVQHIRVGKVLIEGEKHKKAGRKGKQKKLHRGHGTMFPIYFV